MQNAAVISFTSLALDVIWEYAEAQDPLISLAPTHQESGAGGRRNRTQSECVVRLNITEEEPVPVSASAAATANNQAQNDQIKILEKFQEAFKRQDIYWNCDMDRISSLLRTATIGAGGCPALWDGMRAFLEEWLLKRQKSVNRQSL